MLALDPNFRAKKAKKRPWELDVNQPSDPSTEPVSRASVDCQLRDWKRMDETDLEKMRTRIMDLHKELTEKNQTVIKMDTYMHHIPIYLYGRYCKYARDVSQSPWALFEGMTGGAGDDEVDEGRGKDDAMGNDTNLEASASGMVQKGRGNVEDIVGHAVKTYIGAEQVKLHACGREDIDVRCLGK